MSTRTIQLTDWLGGDDASCTIWRIGGTKAEHPELMLRATVALWIGPVSVHLRPTADELDALIEALKWARQRQEVAA